MSGNISEMVMAHLKGLTQEQATDYLKKLRADSEVSAQARATAAETKLNETRALSIEDLTDRLNELHKKGPSNFDQAEHKRYSAVLKEKTDQVEQQRKADIAAIPKQVTRLDLYVDELEKLMADPERNIPEISRVQREINALRFGDERARYRSG